MTITKHIFLDFGTDSNSVRLFAKQYDNNTRTIEITPLINGQKITIENDISVRMQLTKPSGKKTVNECMVTDSGTIVVTLERKNLSEHGLAIADIALYKCDDILSSQSFYIDVEKSAYDVLSDDTSDELVFASDWNTMKNRPFYEEKLYDNINCVYDESLPSSSTIVVDENQTAKYVKIAELKASAKTVVEEIYGVSIGTDNDFQAVSVVEGEGYALRVCESLGEAVCAVDGFCSEENPMSVNVPSINQAVTFTEKGLYVFYSIITDMGVTLFVSNVYFRAELKTLDEKYMPESYGELKAQVAELKALVESLTNAQSTQEVSSDDV